jgi:hypothetical protein
MGPGDGVLATVPYTQERLDIATDALAALDLFGLQEHFDDFCDELGSRYGLDVGTPVRTNTTETIEAPPGLADRIAEDNALDMALYEYARRLYAERHP